jgi:hypothetical protein
MEEMGDLFDQEVTAARQEVAAARQEVAAARQEVAAARQKVTAAQQEVTAAHHHPKQSSLDNYLSSENGTTIWGSNFRFFFNIIWYGVPSNSESWHPQTGWEWFVNQPGQNVIKHLCVCDLHIFVLSS